MLIDNEKIERIRKDISDGNYIHKNLRIPERLNKPVKLLAMAENMSNDDIFSLAIEEYVAAHREELKALASEHYI